MDKSTNGKIINAAHRTLNKNVGNGFGTSVRDGKLEEEVKDVHKKI